jgi:vacuolar iron transporter family protein
MSTHTTARERDARDRLLSAWRSEIIAASLYELIARRLLAPEADILRAMAEAENGHRARLEARMSELGIEIPAREDVRPSIWLRLQARIAPVDRLLAAREAAEKADADELYARPTGDPATDELFEQLRDEERGHSGAVSEIRGGPGVGEDVAVHPARARLDQLLGAEERRRSGGGWISGAIYGANDGLAAVFGIVAGVSGATGGSSFVLTAGVAAAVASALSMATGALLAERAEAEVAAANVERERREIAENPDREQEELSLFYQLKGINEETADAMAEQLSRHPDAMLRALAAEEFGITDDPRDPGQAAIAAGVSTGLGAIVPVIPFMFTTGTVAVVLAATISLVAHFLVGAAKSLVTLRSWWAAGLEMTLAGVIVGGATYLVGLALPT